MSEDIAATLDRARQVVHEVILEENTNHYRECINRVIGLIEQLFAVFDVELLDEAIGHTCEALVLSRGDAYRIGACLKLASSLVHLYDHHGDDHSQDHSWDKAMSMKREMLALRPYGHPDRVLSCSSLATSLKRGYERTNNAYLLDESITLAREALALCPKGHSHRALSCVHLASSLRMRYEHTSDNTLLDEVIDLEREALALRPLGNPDRVASCNNLAGSLMLRYNCTGDDRLLDEAIDLERHALTLCPPGDSDHALSCAGLARLLRTRYEGTGDARFLDEAIQLHREVLSLRPQGHPGRISGAGLAHSLMASYDRNGDKALLIEVVELEREALSLRPRGHPDRVASCMNLANTLSILCHRTGDEILLNEETDLRHEALALCPKGHANRNWSCALLANSLARRYYRTGDETFLYQALDLQREALALFPREHLGRAWCCNDLADSLMRVSDRTGNELHLDEAIALQREALTLCPPEHPDRARSCGELAASLNKRYARTGDEALLNEVMILVQEAQISAPEQNMWRYLCRLSWLHLDKNTAFYNVKKAIQCLSRSLAYEVDSIPEAIREIKHILLYIWDHCEVENKHAELADIYQPLISLLPLLANSALEVQPQLQALKGGSHIGSDAFVNAALAEKSSIGLELLELAQGIIWSQGLYHRDPQLRDVPRQLAKDLEDSLRALSVRSALKSDSVAQRSVLTFQDILHHHSSRAYGLIRDIRLIPGLDRFMMGETFETLCTSAAHHPVVVLVAGHRLSYAMIIDISQPHGHTLLSLDLTDDDINHLLFTPGARRAQRGDIVPEDVPVQLGRAAFKKTAPSYSGPFSAQLKTMWRKIVMPVLDCLGLKVREH
jgi:hypothetical protein